MTKTWHAAVTACVGTLLLTAAGTAPGADSNPSALALNWQEPAPAVTFAPVTPAAFPGADAPLPPAEPESAPTESPAAETVPPFVDPGPAPDKADLEKFSDAEMHCLSVAVYHEARGETRDGQLAVAQVVLNRARSGRFPKSICGVVLQPAQFSSIRSNWNPRESAMWRRAQEIAQQAIEGERVHAVGDALYFHATHVQPGWRMQRVAAVGNHIFYR